MGPVNMSDYYYLFFYFQIEFAGEVKPSTNIIHSSSTLTISACWVGWIWQPTTSKSNDIMTMRLPNS